MFLLLLKNLQFFKISLIKDKVYGSSANLIKLRLKLPSIRINKKEHQNDKKNQNNH